MSVIRLSPTISVFPSFHYFLISSNAYLFGLARGPITVFAAAIIAALVEPDPG